MAKGTMVSVRWLACLAALATLAGCNTDDINTDSLAEPGSIDDPGSTPRVANGPIAPPTDPELSQPPPDNELSQPPSDDELPQPAHGSATLAWMPPVENTDGTALVTLTGYKIHYGMESGDYDHTITIHNPGLTRYVVEELEPGTYYFAVTAISSRGVESELSGEASKTI